MGPRAKKVIGDLTTNKARTLLVIAGIVIGIWGLSTVTTSYAVLSRDLQDNYLNTNPASAHLTVANLNQEMVAAVQAHPDVADAQQRTRYRGRIMMEQNRWMPIYVFVVPDFHDLRISRFYQEQGQSYPGIGETLLERDTLALMHPSIGDSLEVIFPGGQRQKIKFIGTVHDPGLAPAHMDHNAFAYITEETARTLGLPLVKRQLRFTVNKKSDSKEHIREVVEKLVRVIEAQGGEVVRVHVPVPGHHPHQGQLDSLLFLQAAIGGLAFVLSGILIMNMIASLLAEQVRQIGIMKAIGATASQVRGIYLSGVLLMGALATIVAVPAGVASTGAYAWIVARELNFNISGYDIPISLLLFLSVTGCFFAAIAAIGPLIRGTRITVREALASYGLGSNVSPLSSLVARFTRQNFISHPVRVSMRNVAFKSGRAVLTILTLGIGLATFMVAMNLRSSLGETLMEAGESRPFDVEFFFSQPYQSGEIHSALQDIDGIVSAQLLAGGKGAFQTPGERSGNLYTIIAPRVGPVENELPMLSGRWFTNDNAQAIIVNQELFAREDNIVVGQQITLNVNGVRTQWMVAGIAKEIGAAPRVYIPKGSFAKSFGAQGMAIAVRIITKNHSSEFQSSISRELENSFEKAGLSILSSMRKWEDLQVILDHLTIITIFLSAASLLVLLVGGMALTSTMSINVLERSREIGVMRAIGAPDRTIASLLIFEGLCLGTISWLLAGAVSWPGSIFISRFFGELILEVPLVTTLSVIGVIVSALLMLIITVIASGYPARSLLSKPTRELLAYE